MPGSGLVSKNLLPIAFQVHMILRIADYSHETICIGEVIYNVILVVEHTGKVICDVMFLADLEW